MSFVFRRNFRHLTDPLPTVALVVAVAAVTRSGPHGTDKSGRRPTSASAGFQIRIDANPKLATVGDPIQIDLDLTVPSGFQLNVPGSGKEIGDFSILEFYPGPEIPRIRHAQKAAQPAPTQDGFIHHHVRIVAAVYKTGTFTFPPVQLQAENSGGQTDSVSSPPIKIEIQSVLSEKNRDLKDLKKQAEMPEPVRWALWLTVLLALIVLGIFAWFLWKRQKAQAPSVPAVPPQDLLKLAESDLRELLARGFPENGRVKEFYILLSEIVKRILEAGYGINTAERTTSEIMDALRRTSGPSPENVERIESFLVRCDMVKFAKYIPAKAEHESAAADALRILETSRQSLAVVSRQWISGLSLIGHSGL